MAFVSAGHIMKSVDIKAYIKVDTQINYTFYISSPQNGFVPSPVLSKSKLII